MQEFWLCFVPLFVAVDAVGLLPIYMSLTEGMPKAERRRTLRQSLLTAFLVAVAFLFAGKALFRWLAISVQDFMIAGGILLLAFAMSDLLTMEKRIRRVAPDTVGAVPIGIPLIIGPAVLSGILDRSSSHCNPSGTLSLRLRDSVHFPGRPGFVSGRPGPRVSVHGAEEVFEKHVGHVTAEPLAHHDA